MKMYRNILILWAAAILSFALVLVLSCQKGGQRAAVTAYTVSEGEFVTTYLK
jgi:hypothetical protein